MCDTYKCDYLQHSTIDFQLNTDFPFQFCVFYSKITQRSVSQENAFEQSKNPSPFFFAEL